MILVLISGSFETLDTPHKGEIFGQQFDMSEDLARSIVLQGATLLPKEQFDACGFSAEEVAKYSNARRQQGAPEAFLAKLAKAIKAAREYRAALAAPPTKPSSKPEVKT